MEISENVRKITTFCLAVFLWLHALFFLNVQSAFIAKCTQLLRLSSSEVVLFILLVLFSFVAGSGFWKPLRSVAYIYAFPFVLVAYAFYLSFVILRALHRWFKAQSDPHVRPHVIEHSVSPIVPAPPEVSAGQVDAKTRVAEAFRFLLRPFRRFTLLWCLLLLVTTHTVVVWLCLVVVLFHLARDIFRILKVLFFSGPWLKKVGTAVLMPIETAIAGISAVTPNSSPTAEERNLWNQLNLWTKVVNFLKDPYLVSRWAWVLGLLFLGCVYTYIAVLFSCAYYGIARVSNVSYSWLEALVTSLFIRFLSLICPRCLRSGC